MPSRRLPVRLVLLALMAGLSLGNVQAQGWIEVLNSQGELVTLSNVEVLQETLDEVRFQRQGSSRSETRRGLVVAQIDYGPGSEAYEQGKQALAEGDLVNAVNLLGSATRDAEPAWVGPHALLALAEAHALSGANDDALAAVQRFLDEQPEHRLLPDALLLQARLATARGDRRGADAAVERVVDLATSGRISPDWAVRARLAQGSNLLDVDEASDAQAAFAAAIQAAGDAKAALGERVDLAPVLEQLELQARSGTGTALLAADDLAGARTYFTDLARDGADDPTLQAAAANGLAEADFRESGKLKQAQLGFARVAVTAAAAPDERAKALYYLGRCAEALADAGQEKNGRRTSLEYYREVQERYPGSRWARLARESLP